MRAADWLKRQLPRSVTTRLLGLRKQWRRRQWERQVARDSTARIDRGRIANDLRSLGLGPGRDVLVHSAMSKLGLVDGGADAVISAIRDVVGSDVTILMPTYPLNQSMLSWMRDPAPFDVTKTRSEMGKITEVFRGLPGVIRSSHPTHPVAAQGPDAARYVRNHHESGSPAGPGSPFRELSERGGLILCLGTGIGKVTSHHVIEDVVSDFPLQVYLRDPMTKTVIFDDGSRREVTVRVHDPALAPIRVDNDRTCEARILDRMRRRGIVREATVGRATAQLFGAADLDAMHLEGLRDGHTIYQN